MTREGLFSYVKKKYKIEPEYLWDNDYDTGALRHKDTKKWFGIVMKISRNKLGLPDITSLETKSNIGLEPEDNKVWAVNVKCDPEVVGFLTMTEGILPAYHMNKKYWVTILLDGTVQPDVVCDLIDTSFILTDKNVSKRKKKNKDVDTETDAEKKIEES